MRQIRYVLHVKETGGCDYTCSCGEMIVELSEAQNDLEAKRDAVKVVSEQFNVSMGLEFAKIYQLSSEIEIDLKGLKEAIEADRKMEAMEEEENADRAEYERLKAKFG